MHTPRSGSLLMSLRTQSALQDCKKQKQEEQREQGEKQGALLEERMKTTGTQIVPPLVYRAWPELRYNLCQHVSL